MSRKRTTYSAEFKAKVVLEILEGEKSLNEIASKYDLLPKNLQNWKKQFLENVSLTFDKSAVVKEYKEEIEKLKKEKDAMAKKLGEVIIEKDWAVGKLKSLDSSLKKELVDKTEDKIISVVKQCKLLDYTRSNFFYIPMVNPVVRRTAKLGR